MNYSTQLRNHPTGLTCAIIKPAHLRYHHIVYIGVKTNIPRPYLPKCRNVYSSSSTLDWSAGSIDGGGRKGKEKWEDKIAQGGNGPMEGDEEGWKGREMR